MILLLDNYDSFTYNLYQYLCELGAEVEVVRNDRATVEEIQSMGPERIVISPGPGTPKDAGISVPVVRHFAGKPMPTGRQVPILGVCLGHQSIGEAFGGKVAGAGEILHGKTSMISHEGVGVLKGLANPFEAIRYHSLSIQKEGFPTDELEVTAESDSGVIMAVRHKRYPIEGVQFHPESILTEPGHDVLRNFLEM
jgi:anthranilate synthase/aminodeoxychorismate synthase-like glutamine amidotransferase